MRLSAQPGWTALRGTGDPRNRDAFGTRCTPHARRLPSVWRTHAALSLDVCLVASGYPQAHQAGPDNLHADGALGEGSQSPPRPAPPRPAPPRPAPPRPAPPRPAPPRPAPAAGLASSAQRPMAARSPPLAQRWQPSLSAKRNRGSAVQCSAVPPAGLHSQVHGRLATDRLGALTLRTGKTGRVRCARVDRCVRACVRAWASRWVHSWVGKPQQQNRRCLGRSFQASHDRTLRVWSVANGCVCRRYDPCPAKSSRLTSRAMRALHCAGTGFCCVQPVPAPARVAAGLRVSECEGKPEAPWGTVVRHVPWPAASPASPPCDGGAPER